MDTDEELLACVTDWQEVFGRVNWTVLMQTLNGTGINWHERSLTSKLYRGADKSLARPGRKQATATEDFDVHIYYL
jgi:hypothetical protein